ncbi:helix-turn-helix domain-containing protein [Colwelliaceae bacterium 6441]
MIILRYSYYQMINVHPSLTLTIAVNDLLHKSDFPSTLTIEQCASILLMSITSFRRKLTKEETTFKLIQSKYLNELCIEALLTKQTDIDDLAIKLGYSERASFERSFRQKFGITPAQFRALAHTTSTGSNFKKLTTIAENMPPMSESCRQLIEEKEQCSLDLQRVVKIVSKDAIFSARIMGLASKAIYGKTPKSLDEAVSRNLGVSSVVNFAIVYAMKDALQDHVDILVINQYCRAFLIAPKMFQQIRRSLPSSIKFDITLTEQILMFALLGVFILSHKNFHKHQLVLSSLRGIDDLHYLNCHIRETMAISIFSASALMLSLWHVDAKLIKQLNHIENISLSQIKVSKQDELVLFMLSCLYYSASGHDNFSQLSQKAKLLNVDNFDEIQTLFIKP